MICVQDASSQVRESIKISQSGKSSELDSLTDKFSKVCSFLDVWLGSLRVLCDKLYLCQVDVCMQLSANVFQARKLHVVTQLWLWWCTNQSAQFCSPCTQRVHTLICTWHMCRNLLYDTCTWTGNHYWAVEAWLSVMIPSLVSCLTCTRICGGMPRFSVSATYSVFIGPFVQQRQHQGKTVLVLNLHTTCFYFL